MPILPGDTRATDEQLAALLRNHRAGIEEANSLILNPELPAREPLGLLTARDLGAALVSLLDLAEAPEASRTLKIHVINASYDGILAMIDLVKSHSALPKVPRAQGGAR
jgi:serine protease inhibitor